MDSEVGTSLEALAMLGVDYRSVDLLVLDKPWNVMVGQEEMAMKEDLAHQGENCKKMGEKELEEQIYCIDFEGHMDDPDYMKKRLKEWVGAVAAYVRFLHYTHIT
ncbi:hypothetical protein SUGI_0067960 [Cryptomeria japonica]|nr:hypothetical protein SUGI_0067960 [Cryptomeria japonica]